MCRIKRALVAVALSVPLFALCAESDSVSVKKNEFDLGLDFLAHGEIVRGGLPVTRNKQDENQSNFLLGRTRIILGYKRQRLETRAVLQNLAVWGTEKNMEIGLYEAWAKMTAKIGVFGQVGRVALSYDDERIIGTNDFAMASLSHDVVIAGYEGHGHKVHAIFAYNQNESNVYKSTYYNDGAQNYKTMQTVWYHCDVPKFPLGVSLLFMNVGLQSGKPEESYNPPTTEYQQMYGGYLNFHPKYVRFEASYYRQAGKIVHPHYKAAAKIEAWMVSGKATITPSKYYGFVAGYDRLSGDDYVPVIYGGMAGLPFHAVNKGFTPLYGSRTKFYGILDYFYESAFINGFTPGLQNAFLGVNGKPLSKMDLSATYHYLAVATELSGLSSTLGHSLDIQASYNFTDYISLEAGYTVMFGTDTMQRLKQANSSDVAHWAWISLTVSPTLFKTKF